MHNSVAHHHVLLDSLAAMSYLDKEKYKVPGPTNYFKQGHPLTTFTFENDGLSPSIL